MAHVDYGSMDPSGPVFRRPVRVHWAGFVGDTFQMQSEGWQFAVNRVHHMSDLYRDVYEVIARHARQGWAMWGRLRGFRLERDDPFAHAEIVIERCRPETNFDVVSDRPLTQIYKRVNMGSYDEMYQPMQRQQLARSGLFDDWLQPESKEIIVAPDAVADLLERISKLQQPEMLAIRERNRQREARERAPELTHATILSIAA